MKKIFSLLKTRNFWVNLTAFVIFILPTLLLSAPLQYTSMQFGVTYGIPAIILIYVVFYFIDKKKSEKEKELGLQNNNIKKRVPLELKILLVLFFNAKVGGHFFKPIISSPILEQWLSAIIMLGVPIIIVYFIFQEIYYKKIHQIKISYPIVLILMGIILIVPFLISTLLMSFLTVIVLILS